ncbi:SGNH/GDSL hydrolase family protein [Arthrobacter sp. UYCu723]
MTYPPGVQLATLTFSNPSTFLGAAALRTEMTVQSTASVVWTATGQPIDDFAETVAPGEGMPGSLTAPFVDQAGFTDQSGSAFTNWSYVLTRRTFFGASMKTVRKAWAPVLGQATIDFDNLPGGEVGLPVSAPPVPVTSVAGETGAVAAQALADRLAPLLPASVTPAYVTAAVAPKLDASQKGAASGVAPLGEDSRVPDAALPGRLSDATLAATYGPAAQVVSEPLVTAFGNSLGYGKVLALGTSIANSVGATSTATGYPARMASHLNTLLGAIAVIAAGADGNNTGQMLGRLYALLQTHKPTYVTIEVSVNDTRKDVLTSDTSTENYLRRMIALTRMAGATPILITAAQFDATWIASTGNTAYDLTSTPKLLQKNAIARSLATELGVQLVDMFTILRDKVDIWFDGLHPNDAGHNLWGQAIAQKIAQLAVVNQQVSIITDTFDRADSTTAIGGASDGGTWTATGTWGIMGNCAYSPANTNGATLVRDAGQADHVISAVVSAQSGSASKANVGLIARYTDESNYYLLDLNITATGHARIYKRQAGVFTVLSATVAPIWNIGNDVEFMVDGTHLSAYINGVEIVGATDTTHTTGNKAGLWNSSGGGGGSSTWASVKVTK